MAAPPMPDWAPPDGPWCLKQWVPFGMIEPKVDLCLLPPDHEKDCRGIKGALHNDRYSLYIGQLEMKEE